ncbi:hypothetical protein KBZ18_07285 [Synechococcus sp. Cruz-9H2]|uniref:hypothetical protein n=1 Tax=unclassified Synechococcus TaxID=2626047 RepID=UPI0020CC59ED|nr:MULTISPECIES: hypothetical protein [unclassified Synechococcus]MCP9819294.1 hypothetical protein [Synechococcus sp. Cruz-9H2]MCP9843088.1 hypothetical protein [Synechococcus sp. Edmonson 11F2]MCP9854832.1 hypothetical protein [Synechococcus sp. Cruz-9C9]MCP9862697.1 hypothetical protein [Synechococcus sp. Cruz-7E5]MCP9870204.1 hypothetical protein [Synechococcus sp. Cruz-7B9]
MDQPKPLGKSPPPVLIAQGQHLITISIGENRFRELRGMIEPLEPGGLPGEVHATQAQSAGVTRTLQLTEVRDWCMQRLSQLSLDGRLSEARVLTSEHLEMLVTVDAHQTLWMVVEEVS